MLANGSLSWTDQDGDGFLSSGDFFDLQGSPAATYRLEVRVLSGYRVYSVDVPP